MFICQKNDFSSKEVVQSYALFLKNLRQFVPKTFTYVSCHPKMPVFCVKNVKTGVPLILSPSLHIFPAKLLAFQEKVVSLQAGIIETDIT